MGMSKKFENYRFVILSEAKYPYISIGYKSVDSSLRSEWLLFRQPLRGGAWFFLPISNWKWYNITISLLQNYKYLMLSLSNPTLKRGVDRYIYRVYESKINYLDFCNGLMILMFFIFLFVAVQKVKKSEYSHTERSEVSIIPVSYDRIGFFATLLMTCFNKVECR